MPAVMHIAGPVEGQVQRCKRCPYVLTDNRGGVMSTDGRGLSYWQEGAFVRVGGGCKSLFADDDAENTPPCVAVN